MITSNTVFVLGAGASAPYKFPVGWRLREMICQATNPTSQVAKTLLALGCHSEEIRHFARGFQKSNLASIDAYLSRRVGEVDIGKAAQEIINPVNARLFL